MMGKRNEKYECLLQEITFMVNTTFSSGIGMTLLQAIYRESPSLPSVVAYPKK